MTLSEIIAVLKDDGHDATQARIAYLISRDIVARPHKDGSGRYDYDTRHLEELRRYYAKHPPRKLK